VSKFGLLGQLVATASLFARYLDGSYAVEGAYCVKAVSSVNIFAAAATVTTAVVDTKKWFVLASLLSYCFVTHYNSPKYYTELENTSPPRFLKMASISYAISAVLYVVTMGLGLALFGTESKSFLLNNLSPHDPLAIIARLAFGASVLAGYPLIFLVMRNWFIDRAKTIAPILGGVKRITLLLLAGIAFLATKFTDIGFVGNYYYTMLYNIPTIFD